MSASTNGLNLLLVDDSVMMRAMLKRAAQLSGVPLGAIHEASNGAEALALLEREAVDALFTDLNMPVMTGVELLRAIDERRRWPGLIRVIISADGSTARRQQDASGNDVQYLGKPFKPEAIRDVLAALL
jgi:two-component system, chemotaxis family, chemotaxis protein CheY